MNEKRRATIYYGGFAFRGGGAFNHAKVMRDELHRAGWHVDLFTLESLPVLVRYLPHVVGRIVNRFNPPMGFYYKDQLTRFLYKCLFAVDSDLRIFEDIYLSWNSNVPSVTLLHAVWSDNLHSIVVGPSGVERLIRAEERAIDLIQHPVVTVSHCYRDSLIRSHHASSRLPMVSVVPLGLDVAQFDTISESRRAENSLVYCGSLESRKNIGLLMRVFQNLHQSDDSYRLTIIGDGPDRDELERHALKHRLPVVFRGRLDRNDVIRELKKHSLYVHTSFKESFSFALLEAKLAGLKTVAFQGLEVPHEFIDVPVTSFDEHDWVASIRQAPLVEATMLDRSAYSSQTMMRTTLQLALESR